MDVKTTQNNIGVYATDTFDITDRLALTLAGRYQIRQHHASATGAARIRRSTATTPSHRFSPAAGLTFEAYRDLTLFASYSEGFRAPTPAELTCADPSAPCELPNAFLADPPLKPVVARTYEFGARGKLPLGTVTAVEPRRSSAPTLDDDILFTHDPDRGRRLLPERRQDAPPGRGSRRVGSSGGGCSTT